MISVAEALAQVLALAPAPRSEEVMLRHAAGRVLMHAAQALRDQPPFAASAMDGYAILEADHRPGHRLRVIGEAAAGHAFGGSVAPGEAVRIFTGAPLPAGAERVILQEDVARDGAEILLGERLEAQIHIRPRGQDFPAGFSLEAPRRLRPADLALLASMGLERVSVARRPEVAILATGDELVMPGECPGEAQIVASNSFALAAMVEAAGGRARLLPIARDRRESLAQAFALARGADLVVTIGGASVGDHDLVGQVAADQGLERAFWKVAVRPGKPLMAGRMAGMTLLGLPGNPVSSIVCGHLFLLPLLAVMQGLPGEIATETARLAAPVEANGPRAHYMRARLLPPEEGSGLPGIAAMESQDSARLRLMSEAEALLIRPVGDRARALGERVAFIRL